MAEPRKLIERVEHAMADKVDSAALHHVETGHVPGTDELRREQQEESQEAWAVPGAPALSPSQAIGMAMGALIGAVIGALVFFPVGFIPFGGRAIGWRLLITSVIGAFAGATAGAVYWGGRAPEITGEVVDGE
jgi:hypothetical protein